jgi:hypothetical protein
MDAITLWVIRLLPYLVAMAFIVFPASRILKRMGFSPWFALTLFIPFFGLAIGGFIGLWLLAFVRWPALDIVDLYGVFADSADPDADTPMDPAFLTGTKAN